MSPVSLPVPCGSCYYQSHVGCNIPCGLSCQLSDVVSASTFPMWSELSPVSRGLCHHLFRWSVPAHVPCGLCQHMSRVVCAIICPSGLSQHTSHDLWSVLSPVPCGLCPLMSRVVCVITCPIESVLLPVLCGLFQHVPEICASTGPRIVP